MQEWWVNMTGIYNGLVIKQPSHFSGDGLQVYSFLISDPCFTAGIGSTIKDPQLGTLRVAVQELAADGNGNRIRDTKISRELVVRSLPTGQAGRESDASDNSPSCVCSI